jgi:HEAT repeat protein
MDDLSRWLTDDLGNDLDAQASVLAIVFGSAIPPAAGVSWLAFDELRRQITELLRKELRISEDEPSSPPGLGRDFLHRARAYVAIMPSPLTDLVRFRDERYPQRLWQALLGPARNLATLMIPLLQELARGRSPVLREIATTALGRLGQIGPFDLAVPLLRSWIRQKPSGEELAGGLLQGSIGSGDETYKNLCLATIRDLVLEGSDGVAETAVRSLSLLGMPEPAVPIRELCDIAQERLLIQLDTLREVDREITEKEEEIRRGYDPRQVASALKSLHKRGDLMLIAALVPEDQIRLLGAAQYALAGVLFSQGGDPGPVLRELLAQMKAEPVKLAPLFAYFFLHRYGLIDLLDRYKWSSSDFDTDTSRFLLASRQGERDPEALRELLEKIFLALETFPGFFRFLLERRFFEILKSWSQEGCEVIGLRPTVVRLLSVLRATGNGALRSRLERFLETDPEFVVRGSRLQALARDVLAGQGLEDVPARISRPRRLPGWLKKSEDTNS